MSSKYFILIFILFFPLSLLAQEEEKEKKTSFSVMSGFGTYSMGSLKDFNDNVVREAVPFDLRTIDNFEPNIYFTASLMQRLGSSFRLGLNYQFHSTGSRLGQKDYSGVYTFDIIMKSHSLAFEPEILLSRTSKIKLYSNWLFGLSLTDIETKEIMSLTDYEQNYDENFASFAPFIQPSFKLKISVLKNVEWVSVLGGCIDFGGAIHLDGEKDAKLEMNGDPVKTSWSGLRLQTGLEIAIF